MQPVADRDVGSFERSVVDGGLMQGRFSYRLMGGLAFDDKPRQSLRTVDYDIGAFLQFIVAQAALYAHQTSGILFYVNEVVDEMLAYPLFGCEYDEFLPNTVKNPYFTFSFPEFVVEGRKVEADHAQR